MSDTPQSQPGELSRKCAAELRKEIACVPLLESEWQAFQRIISREVEEPLLATLAAKDREQLAALNALAARCKALEEALVDARETLRAIRAININELGGEGDAAINRLIDSCAALAKGGGA
jgi:hypothetical protein